MDEFALIKDLFAPLTRSEPGAYGLQDDVAHLVCHHAGHILTVDQVIEGTHFLAADPLDLVAKKLVRRNLSDLIAKGAKPVGALLTLAWPRTRDRAQMAQFAEGLGQDLAIRCGECPLLGGDTSTTDGPLVASLTLFGHPLGERLGPVLRSGARPGDVVLVSGRIGLASLGLKARLGQIDPGPFAVEIAASLLPDPPPLAYGALIAEFASASIDVSDGLLADLGHLLDQSGVALQLTNIARLVEAGMFPASRESHVWALDDFIGFLTGGDDYQTVCTVPPDRLSAFLRDSKALGVKVFELGTLEGVQAGKPNLALMFEAEEVALPTRRGWSI